MGKRYRGEKGRNFLVSVDGMDFMIFQTSPFCSGWYSHKFRGPGLIYEVGLGIQCGDIVWVRGTYACRKWTDMNIFRNGMMQALDQGEQLEADAGYAGEVYHVELPHETYGSKSWKAKNTRVRSCHEMVNSRFKVWSILKTTYKYTLDNNRYVFRDIVVITKLEIENGKPLFQVE